ncbi:hypothetical protein M409DRAFT_55316 [Zasmidium cellare ATCC 36951]|uniref:Uncharacterized protein n=1 Tax=Zasmidium cellare ATCC 36951 TaxID=1080233 RepID=A0A6A6CFG8_ZASCE|nr:uncharacterized protein M409DRAFT_55316 [Zasmidium cellare ATCC 36951]KAF2165954.1 hypothetical protein M409DRAFT_55316 [Zasmidium cellare ATCC 36951]
MARTVLITGCFDGGIGAALAVAYHKNKEYRVLATTRNTAKMTSLAALGITTLQLDVLSDASVAECASEVSKLTGGSLDILINNAGGGYSMPLLDAPLDEISKQFDLNALSILRMTRGFMHLLRRSQSPHGALVANNTSLVSTLPVPLQGAYSASKAAAASITECLRLELQMFGIQVIDLKTASVKTAFLDNVPNVRLPSDSHYAKQRDVVEKRLREGPEAQPITATAWAEQIVRDLSCSRPSPVIYRGGSARLGRLLASLPIGLRFKDSTIKEFSGLKEVEEAFKNRGEKDD